MLGPWGSRLHLSRPLVRSSATHRGSVMLARFGLVQVTLVSPRWVPISSAHSAPTQRRRARTRVAGRTQPVSHYPSPAFASAPPHRPSPAAPPRCHRTRRRPPKQLASSPREDRIVLLPAAAPDPAAPRFSVLDLTGVRPCLRSLSVSIPKSVAPRASPIFRSPSAGTGLAWSG